MSFDVTLTIDTGGDEMATVADIGDITYNVNPMFHEALDCGLRDLHGRVAGEILGLLRKGVADMQDRPRLYTALNPENGWGNAEIAREFLENFVAECARHPKATVAVW